MRVRCSPWQALIAGLALGCTTGPFSIGNDRALECQPDDCLEMPADMPICSNRGSGRYVCRRGEMDPGCSWFLECPAETDSADVCPASACDAPPAQAPMCSNGVWGSGWACDPDETGCTWSGICPEQTRDCPPDECEPASGPVAECMGGDMIGLACLRASDDQCRWTSIACAPQP